MLQGWKYTQEVLCLPAPMPRLLNSALAETKTTGADRLATPPFVFQRQEGGRGDREKGYMKEGEHFQIIRPDANDEECYRV